MGKVVLVHYGSGMQMRGDVKVVKNCTGSPKFLSLKDNYTNEIQKHLQLHNVRVGEYVTDRYALWLDFRMIDENSLHGTGRRIENASEGITLQIEKKAESDGSLNAYIYLIMDAQLNIRNGAYVSELY